MQKHNKTKKPTHQEREAEELNILGKKQVRQTYAWLSKTLRLMLHLHLAENPRKSVPSVEKNDKSTSRSCFYMTTQTHQRYSTTLHANYRYITELLSPTVVIWWELLRRTVRLIFKLHFAIDAGKMSVPRVTKFLLMLKLSRAYLSTNCLHQSKCT